MVFKMYQFISQITSYILPATLLWVTDKSFDTRAVHKVSGLFLWAKK